MNEGMLGAGLQSIANKKCTEVDWQDVRIFLALVRQGSLSAAARTLSVTHATISRRISSLEESLGERLVERRPGGYVLTRAGTHALEAASNMEQAAQILGRGTMDGAPSGFVRISASPALSIGFLTSRLANLASRYPRLDIDLASKHRSSSLARHEADIALCFKRPQDSDVIVRPLVTIGHDFYGTHEVCCSIETGADPVLVGFNEADAYLPTASWMAHRLPHMRLALRVNDHFAQSIAIRSGNGIALLPHYIGRCDPLLRTCDLKIVAPSRDLFMLIRKRDRQNPAICVVVDEIVRMFDQARELFA